MSDKSKKILKGIIGTTLTGLTVYALYNVAKEYDDMVDNYNELVDKYNSNIDFINSCDFYEYKSRLPEDVSKNDVENNFVKTIVKHNKDGTIEKETKDLKSGLSVISIEDPHNILNSDPMDNVIKYSVNDFKIIGGN